MYNLRREVMLECFDSGLFYFLYYSLLWLKTQYHTWISIVLSISGVCSLSLRTIGQVLGAGECYTGWGHTTDLIVVTTHNVHLVNLHLSQKEQHVTTTSRLLCSSSQVLECRHNTELIHPDHLWASYPSVLFYYILFYFIIRFYNSYFLINQVII